MAALTSNGLPVPLDPEHLAPMRDSSALLDRPTELRARFAENGYLLLRGVVDPDALRELRATYFSRFDRSYFKPGSSPADGLFSGRRPADLPAHGVKGHPAYDFVRDEAFQRFVSSPVLADVAASILDGPVQRLPRSILRHFDSSHPAASRAHVDYRYLDAGTDRLVTMWIPVGDCPVAAGGLIYLEGSHREDPDRLEELQQRAHPDRPDDRRPISHDLAWVGQQLGRRWLWADYRAGDVAIHSPHIVHASLDTTTEMMRMSADVRFLRQGEAADPRWQQPWAGDDGN